MPIKARRRKPNTLLCIEMLFLAFFVICQVLVISTLVDHVSYLSLCGLSGGNYTSPYSLEWVDGILGELDWGNIVFNAPSHMRYKGTQRVELLLSPTLDSAQLQTQLMEKGGVEYAKVHVANRMQAQLTGQGFAIEALMPDLQGIGSERTTRWEWEVTSTRPGIQQLYLSLSAWVDIAGHDAPVVIQTFYRTIDVEITIPQRLLEVLQRNWQWLCAAVLTPIAIPIAIHQWNRWKKRIRLRKRNHDW